MLENKIYKGIISLLFAVFFLANAFGVSAASLDITTMYTKTGGIQGALNQVGDLVNGVSVCPADPTDGCDFSDDPGYNNNGTVDDSSDDFYTGDLLVRTNDVFEVNAAWSWSGVEGGPEEEVTLVGTLPATGEFEWTNIPGSCDPNGSSLSADKLTITCVRNDFADGNSHAEDLLFTARVLGSTPNGAQPGDISFSVSGQNAITVTDDTDGNSLTVTASPRWNLDKDLYVVRAGQSFDDDNDPNTPDVNGYILNYLFLIETDEVDGETDDAPASLGNESMGSDATFTFTDEIDEIAPHAQLVDCTMEGRSPQHDGYVGSTRPVTKNDGIHSNYPEQTIPQPGGEQQVTCTQNGTTINVTVSHVDATLDNAPTHSYDGNLLPVNRKIAAIGSINIFVPLSDVENGNDGQSGTGDDGELSTKNKLRNFDPTTPTGNSNFGANTESETDNDRYTTLYGMRGSFSKYYRGEESSVWTYPGGATTARSGDGVVNQGYEFSTVLVNNNTGGTDYTEEMCDVVDAYRLEIQDIENNTIYNTIKTAYGNGAYRDNSSPVFVNIWNGSGDYNNNQSQSPYEFEYSARYVDNSWLPSRGGDQTVSHKTQIEAECNDNNGWFATADEARADAQGVGAITKIRIKLRNGVTHPPGAYSYTWINHKVRATDLLTGQPLQNGDEIGNWSAWSFNGATFTGADYIISDYPNTTTGTNGDRVTFSGAKARIHKTADITNVSPNQIIHFTLESSYTNDTGTTETGHVIIKDIMPKDITYVAGSVTGANEPTVGSCADVDQSLTCDDNENQVLIWDLGNIDANDPIDDIVFEGQVSPFASAGNVTNMSTIWASSDTSEITQRRSSVGLNISVPATLNISKSVNGNERRERTTTGEDIDYEVNLRNGKPGQLTDLDVIDILPFIGDGNSGAIHFNNDTTARNPGTQFHGTNEFVSVSVLQHPQSSAVCDITANGGVKYYYTTEAPTNINLAPSVGEANVIGGPQTIWEEGTASAPPAGMNVNDVTAVRIIGPTMDADAICQVQVKMHINDNLADDIYSNSAGASAQGVTLPVMSNSKAVTIVGSSISNRVWIDDNADGIQDAGENGLANVQVELLDGNGNPVNDPATGQPYVVQTNAQGEYLFEKLDHGDYQVRFTVPADYHYSDANQGGDDAVDADVTNVNSQIGTTDTITLGVEEDNDTIDAGIYQLVSIGDFIWEDVDNDGIQDAGENGIAGVTVKLLDENGNPVDNPNNPGNAYEVTTNASGEYVFENIKPGRYIVEIIKPANYLNSPQNAGGDNTVDSDFNPANDRTSVLVITSGVDDVDIDGGLYQPVGLGGKAWKDLDNNGVQDAGEDNLQGATVTLLDSNGNPVDDPNNPGTSYTIITDANGEYLFEDIIAGDYQVRVIPPTGYELSPQNAGGDDTTDSDFNQATFTTDMVTVGVGEYVSHVDAGMHYNASLGGIIWEDTNVDGVQDVGENSLNNVQVKLLDSNGNPVNDPSNPGAPYEVMTDSNGNYLFENIMPGNYIVEVVPPNNYYSSEADQGGDDSADSDFSPADHRVTVTVADNEDKREVDGGLYQTANLSGKVWRDDERNGIQADWEPGLEGVTVELLDGNGNPVDDPNNPGTPYTVITGADGSYIFENLVPGDYQVRFTPPADHNPSDKDQGGDDTRDSDIDINTLTTDNITVNSGENKTNIDAGFYALYANVFDPPSAIKTVSDSGESEIEWKMVWINDGNMVAVNTQVLDDVPTGTTYVSGSVLCEARGLSTTSVCTYDSAENRIRWEGDIAPDPGGTTEDDSLNEVVITYRTTVPVDMETVENQASANWDANGDGNFNDDIAGGQAPVLTDDSDINGDDPTIWQQTKKEKGEGSIGNTIWLDKNGNGRQDDGEPGLENIRVKLVDDKGRVIARTDTNHNGHYKFENLPKGKYKVIVKKEDVAKYIQTYDPDSKMDGKDTVHLRSKQNYTKADFGYTTEEWELARTGDNSMILVFLMVFFPLLCGFILISSGKYYKKAV